MKIKKKKYIRPFIEIDDLGEDLLQIGIGSEYDNDARQSKESCSGLVTFDFDDDNGNGSENNGLYSY